MAAGVCGYQMGAWKWKPVALVMGRLQAVGAWNDSGVAFGVRERNLRARLEQRLTLRMLAQQAASDFDHCPSLGSVAAFNEHSPCPSSGVLARCAQPADSR